MTRERNTCHHSVMSALTSGDPVRILDKRTYTYYTTLGSRPRKITTTAVWSAIFKNRKFVDESDLKIGNDGRPRRVSAYASGADNPDFRITNFEIRHLLWIRNFIRTQISVFSNRDFMFFNWFPVKLFVLLIALNARNIKYFSTNRNSSQMEIYF